MRFSPPQRKNANNDEAKSSKRDLLALVERHADDDPKLKELWTQIHTVPEWVDWEQIKRGREVFFSLWACDNECGMCNSSTV